MGRTPDYLDLTGFQNALAAGSSLSAIRASIAASLEAQSDLNGLYATELGRFADSVGLASFTQALANGASLGTVKAVLAASPEAAATISSVYQADAGHTPNAIALAGEQSELQSGALMTVIQAALGELADVDKVPGQPITDQSVTITPDIIGGSTPSFVYGLGGNAALVSPSASEKVTTFYGPFGAAPTAIGFNPATDFIQVPIQEVPN